MILGCEVMRKSYHSKEKNQLQPFRTALAAETVSLCKHGEIAAVLTTATAEKEEECQHF